MKNLEFIKYTYFHRKVVIYLANKYVKDNKKEIMKQIKKHDLDKMFMYMFYNKSDASSIHRKLSTHHENNLEKSHIDYIEMELDWESARYTKNDKPLNAYDTLYKYYPSMEKEITPILEEFKINEPNLPKEKDVEEYVKSIQDVSLEDIKEEYIKYINDFFS